MCMLHELLGSGVPVHRDIAFEPLPSYTLAERPLGFG